MANKWVYENTHHRVEIEAAVETLIAFPDIHDIAGKMSNLNTLTPIQLFQFKQEPAPDLHLYNYKFTFQDGRVYRQELDFSVNANNPNIHFYLNSDTPWLVEELLRNPPIRTVLVKMKSLYGMTKYTWEAK